jgi:hypothetical protein
MGRPADVETGRPAAAISLARGLLVPQDFTGRRLPVFCEGTCRLAAPERDKSDRSRARDCDWRVGAHRERAAHGLPGLYRRMSRVVGRAFTGRRRQDLAQNRERPVGVLPG